MYIEVNGVYVYLRAREEGYREVTGTVRGPLF
jgi:hypothetical protein